MPSPRPWGNRTRVRVQAPWGARRIYRRRLLGVIVGWHRLWAPRSSASSRQLARFAGPLSVYALASTGLMSVDIFFVKAIVASPDAAGYYAAGQNIAPYRRSWWQAWPRSFCRPSPAPDGAESRRRRRRRRAPSAGHSSSSSPWAAVILATSTHSSSSSIPPAIAAGPVLAVLSPPMAALAMSSIVAGTSAASAESIAGVIRLGRAGGDRGRVPRPDSHGRRRRCRDGHADRIARRVDRNGADPVVRPSRIAAACVGGASGNGLDHRGLRGVVAAGGGCESARRLRRPGHPVGRAAAGVSRAHADGAARADRWHAPGEARLDVAGRLIWGHTEWCSASGAPTAPGSSAPRSYNARASVSNRAPMPRNVLGVATRLVTRSVQACASPAGTRNPV